MQRLIPRSYPRQVQEKDGKSALGVFAIVLGIVAATATLIAVGLTFQQRHKRVFVFAQIEFVWLLLFGLLLVSSAAVLTALPPTDPNCVARAWLINVGYSFELVPLVVKIAAINSLMQAAKRMRRIVLGRSLLFGIVGALTGLVVIYMTIWTIFDPPEKEGEYELTNSRTAQGETIVSVTYYCASSSRVWMLVAVGVQGLLLLCASVLAFMTRKMRKDINEANTIAFLIYWNFVCVLLRIILFLLHDKVDAAKLNRSLSMIISLDSFATIIIYFVPKFRAPDKQTTGPSHAFVSVGIQDMWKSGDDDRDEDFPTSSDLAVRPKMFRKSNDGPRVSWADDNDMPLSLIKSDSFKVEEQSGTINRDSNPHDEEKVGDYCSDRHGNDDLDDDVVSQPTAPSTDAGSLETSKRNRLMTNTDVWMSDVIETESPLSSNHFTSSIKNGDDADPKDAYEQLKWKSWM